MSILSELFSKTVGVWDAASRIQLSDAVTRLTAQSGGIRALSRQLNIPLTSLNRGIATNFATSRASTLDRLQTAVSDAGIFFATPRKYSTALDMTTYRPGTIRLDTLPRPSESTGLAKSMTIVAKNVYGYDATLTRQVTYDLGNMQPDEIIQMSGVDGQDIERVIFSW